MKEAKARSLMAVRERERERELFFREISFFKHENIWIGYMSKVRKAIKKIELLQDSLSFL